MDEEEFENEANKTFAWEEEYKRSWDLLKEDEHGSLKTIVNQFSNQQKRKRRQRQTKSIHRGIIRNLYIVVDISRTMAELDLKPSRLEVCFGALETFITEFYDQNPLSLLGILITRDGIAEKLTDLGSDPNVHINALRMRANREPRGEASLQNSLEMSLNSLLHVPSHTLREVLVVFGSLTTCDPSDIFTTLEALKKYKVRVSVIGLGAEVQICRLLTKGTDGTYSVVLNENHLKDLLLSCVPPPPITDTNSGSNLVHMGFPQVKNVTELLCSCHSKLQKRVYECPNCCAKVCNVPLDCPICGLTLVSSPLLARSYHHLFPIPNFVETRPSNNNASNQERCFGCQTEFGEKEPRYICSKCTNVHCIDCDIFIHDSLHNCPGCEEV